MLRYLLASLFLFICFLSPMVAQAQTAPAAPPDAAPIPITLSVPIGNVRQVSGIAEYINLGYRYLVSVILVVAIIMVVWGGFRYLLGSANIGNVQRGKEIIRDAVVGMLLVIGAFVILNTVNPQTVALRDLDLSQIIGQGAALDRAASGSGAQSAECQTDADCTGGRRCLETEYEFTRAAMGASEDLARGVGLGATQLASSAVGGAAGSLIVGYASLDVIGVLGPTQGGQVRRCSDGSAGAPCGEDSHCTTGVCFENWHLCGQRGGQPVGAICEEDGNCAGSNCQAVENSSIFRAIGNLSVRPSTCRGRVPNLTDEIYRDNGFHINGSASRSECFVNGDCSDSDSHCDGPRGWTRRFCSPNANAAAAGRLCFIGRIPPAGLTPSGCFDPSGAVICTFCPTDGDANWQRLDTTTDPDGTKLGICKDRNQVGQPCRRASVPSGSPSGGSSGVGGRSP
jgi:hypothetical protein